MAEGLNEVIQIKGLQISWTSKRVQQIDLQFVKHLPSIFLVPGIVLSTL